MTSYNDKLTSIFILYGIPEVCRSEIRHLFIEARKDAERNGYTEGWEMGQSHCEFDR
jgi:hypothetical protein